MRSDDEKARRKQARDAYRRAERERRPRMPVDRAQLEALLDHVDEAVEDSGCDHTRRAADAWAAAHGVDLSALHLALEEHGGYCDCEVVLNVDPDEVFGPVRQPRG